MRYQELLAEIQKLPPEERRRLLEAPYARRGTGDAGSQRSEVGKSEVVRGKH